MPPPVLADRYELGDLLGRGGMGAVYRGRDLTLGRDVAVKVLDVNQVTPHGLERFRREARALARMSHPHIVTIFDFSIADQSAWLVMELLPGPDVSTLVSRHGQLPVPTVLHLGQQLAAALAAAHDAGIVHRDVKPANVMLAGEDDFKLLDLGIARLVGDTATTHADLTQTGTILGSLPFVAPEVIAGQPSGPPADLYGLGGVLFTALTGAAPFAADTATATLAQHLHAPPPRAAATRDDVPPGLDQLIDDLLAKDPQDRPSAADCATALAALLGDRSGTAVGAAREATPTHVLENPHTRTRPMPATPVTADAAEPDTRRRRLAKPAAIALGMVALLLLLVHACGSGSPHASPPAPAPTTTPRAVHTSARPTTQPTTRLTTTRPPAPAVLTLPQALRALATAVNAAAANGGLAPGDARDLQHQVSELRKNLAQSDDVAHRVQDFAKHLSDLQQQGHISATAYEQIRTALRSVQTATTR